MKDNKLIAEFMGEDYNHQIGMICSELYLNGHRSAEIIENKEPKVPYSHYHNSMDWLIPVIEKINPESMTTQKVVETRQASTFSQKSVTEKYYNTAFTVIDENGVDVSYSAAGDTIIESIYNCVLEYIK